MAKTEPEYTRYPKDPKEEYKSWRMNPHKFERLFTKRRSDDTQNAKRWGKRWPFSRPGQGRKEKEDTSGTTREESRVTDARGAFFIFSGIVFIILILTCMTFAVRKVPITENVMMTKLEVYNETLDSRISFSGYVGSPYEWEGKQITLTGFLHRYVKGGRNGVYTEALIDDYGNTIDLLDIPSALLPSIPRRGSTTQLYNITGQFRRSYKTLQLTVGSYAKTDRLPAGVVEKQRNITYPQDVTRYESVPMFPGLRAFVMGIFGEKTA